MSQPDFRQVLRGATQADHARVDTQISTIDLTTSGGFVRFLSIHQACFRVFHGLAQSGSDAGKSLGDMLFRIETDLEAMGTACADEIVSDMSDPDPLAIDYMVEGSRLGSKILRNRWLSSNDLRVKRASAYFTLVPEPGRWRFVCDQLALVPVNSERAEKIVTDTKLLFALFYDAAVTPVDQQLGSVEATS